MAKGTVEKTERNNRLVSDYLLVSDDGSSWAYSVNELSEKYDLARQNVYKILRRKGVAPRPRKPESKQNGLQKNGS